MSLPLPRSELSVGNERSLVEQVTLDRDGLPIELDLKRCLVEVLQSAHVRTLCLESAHLEDVRLNACRGGQSLLDHERDFRKDIHLLDQSTLAHGRAELVDNKLGGRLALAVPALPGPDHLNPGRGLVPSLRVVDGREVSRRRDLARLVDGRVLRRARGARLSNDQDRHRVLAGHVDRSEVDLCSAGLGSGGAVRVLPVRKSRSKMSVTTHCCLELHLHSSYCAKLALLFASASCEEGKVPPGRDLALIQLACGTGSGLTESGRMPWIACTNIPLPLASITCPSMMTDPDVFDHGWNRLKTSAPFRL